MKSGCETISLIVQPDSWESETFLIFVDKSVCNYFLGNDHLSVDVLFISLIFVFSVSLTEKAVFYGNTSICYAATGNYTRLMIIFVSFNPFSSNGTILHRYEEKCHRSCSTVILFLQHRYLNFVATHGSCKAIATWPYQLEVNFFICFYYFTNI